MIEQNQAAASGKSADLQALVAKGQTWQVEKEPRAELPTSARAEATWTTITRYALAGAMQSGQRVGPCKRS